jgi:steroid delta-isomerase-like uncharacterized protein
VAEATASIPGATSLKAVDSIRRIGFTYQGGGRVGNTATLEGMYERINAHDVDGFCDYLADDFVEHETAPGLAPTKEGVRQFFTLYMAGFPDLHFEAEDILASGDKVVGRVRCTGTNTGEFMGMPATGKSVTVQAIDIIRVGDDDLAHEHWGVFDALAMMQQLGAIPDAAPA